MAIGDDAVAAGMDLVSGAALANTLDTEENKTRDYIAQRTNAITPVTKGGTGSSTAAGARSAFGITDIATVDPVTVVRCIPGNTIQLRWEGNRINVRVGVTEVGYFASNEDIGNLLTIAGTIDGKAVDAKNTANSANSNADGRVAKGGDTMTGNLFLPNSSAATSGFTVCYINGDGRVSRGSSSRRYKKNIRDVGGLGNLFAAPLREYRMKVDGIMPDDPTFHVGYIAEELLGTDMERFVVYVDGEVESIDFIALLLAQNAQLHERLTALEAAS